MPYLQSVVLVVLSFLPSLSLITGAVASSPQRQVETTPVPARTISPAKIHPTPPPWAWWATIALIPIGTTAGLMYGLRRSARQTHLAHATHAVQTPIEHPGTPGTFVSETRTSETRASELTHTPRLSKVDGVESLLTDLHHPDPAQRHKVIWELGQRGDSRAVQPLVELMSNSDSLQRSLILAAVAEIGIRTLQPMHRALLLSLQDDSSDVRKNAIRDVTRLYDLISPISPLLQFAIDDVDGEVRETADWALKRLNRIRLNPSSTETSLESSLKPLNQDNSPLLPAPLPEYPAWQGEHNEESNTPP